MNAMKHGMVSIAAAMLGVASLMAQGQPAVHELTGGGSLSIRRDGDQLLVSVTGPRAGLASLCLGDGSRVRILHASAAIAEAIYEKSGADWTLASGFGQFALRETRTGPPPEADRRAFFDAKGWVANASNAGTVAREFTIRVDQRARYLGVAFYATSAPEAVSYWPATMSDDCRAVKVAQGFLPATAQFRPDSWYPVR
jgi:hypothetical protein